MQKLSTKAILRNVRLSFCNLLTPVGFTEDDTDKRYRTDIIISKDNKEAIGAIKVALENALKNAEASNIFAGKSLKQVTTSERWHSALKDGDKERPEDEAYKNSYFLSAWATIDRPPVIFDKAKNKITKDTEGAEDKVYSGVYVTALISFFAYNYKGQYGTGTTISGLVTYQKGEKLSGVDVESELEDEFDEDSSDDSLDELL